MASPTIKNHTIACGKRFTLKALDEHGDPVEHHIYPSPVSATPTPPSTPTGPSGPAPFKPIPPVAATVIAGERPEDDVFNVAIPFSELPELSRSDVEQVVAYRLDVTSSMADGLHIDIPGSALPNMHWTTVVMLGVAPDGAGGLR